MLHLLIRLKNKVSLHVCHSYSKKQVNQKVLGNCGKLVIKLRCNYCQGIEHDVITKYTRFEMNNVLKCKQCGLVSMKLEKDKDTIESFYSSEYRKTPLLPIQPAEEHYFDEVTQHDTNTRISFISKYVDINGKKVLEIGSASGSLLNKLSE